MNDELTVKIANELINVAQLVEARMESGEWENETYVTPAQIAERIIALVRVDERKRIREALLSTGLRPAAKSLASEIDVDFDWLTDAGNDTHGFAQDYYRSAWHMLETALAAIGLTEEPS